MSDGTTPELLPSSVERNGNTSSDGPELSAEFVQLWRQGKEPDICEFAQMHAIQGAQALAALVTIDQRERWSKQDRKPAEDYFQAHAALQQSGELALDVVFNEFLIRERLGERPSVDEYCRRFPALADSLAIQLELHAWMDSPQEVNSLAAPTNPESLTAITTPLVLADTNVGRLPVLQDMPEAFSVLPCSFGRYEILELLGRGGMGAVFRARDTHLRRMVALKVVRHLSYPQRSEAIERFFREARAAAALNHPNLCAVYDMGVVDDIPYLTMPLLQGDSLDKVIKESGPLDEASAAKLTRTIALALQEAHTAGVVHRDVKPSNLFIRDSGEPVVIDFGLALDQSMEMNRLTSTHTAPGTPAYLAPEQLRHEGNRATASTDIYGLGVVLYEMLTGVIPFQGSVYEVFAGILHAEPPPPSRFRNDLSPELEATCLKAMRKDPLGRQSSMTELAAELSRFLHSLEDPKLGGTREPGVDSQAPFHTPESQAVQPLLLGAGGRARRRWLAWAAAPVLLLLFAIVLQKTWRVDPPKNASSTAQGGVWKDTLLVGTRWDGVFSFRAPYENYRGDVQLLVTARDGERFEASYLTESGAYEWKVSGKVWQGKIDWRFVQAVRDNPAITLVDNATVEGDLQGESMKVVFRIPHTESVADMHLALAK